MFKLPASFAFLCFTALCSTTVHSEESKSSIKVIDPEKRTATANVAALDTEHFEVGFHAGMLSVEDFNTNPVIGASLRYYFNEKIFIEANLGRSKTKRSHTEDGADFVFDRSFQYLGLAAGYKILEGRSFWGKKRKLNSGLFLTGGIEQVDFNEENEIGLSIGVSYKTALTDLIGINIDFKDHIVNRDFSGEDKLTQNIEMGIGVSLFF